MVASWMLYSLVVATLLAAASLPLARAVRLRGGGTRWVWATAVWGALLIPAVSHGLADRFAEAPLDALGPVTPVAAPLTAAVTGLATGLDATAAPVLDRVQAPILRLWALASTVLFGALAASALRLHVVRRRWREVEMGGEHLLVSNHVGPAVLGLLRQRIVVPAWVLERGPDARELILAHEREHVRARDPLLVFLAAIPAVLLPWNVALWWALRRLRVAVEVDCDARVLRGRTPGTVRRYGRLLVEVGRRTSHPVGAVAAFSEGRSSLERRIRSMTTRTPDHPGRLAAALGMAGAILVLGACVVPSPDAPSSPVGPDLARSSSDGSGDIAKAPAFTPYTVAPEVLNRAEVQAALVRAYPSDLLDRGVGGTARVYFFIDERGRVVDTRLDRSSGVKALDRAALGVATVMRFSPALNRDDPVPVWISLPITFQVAPDPRAVERARPWIPQEPDGVEAPPAPEPGPRVRDDAAAAGGAPPLPEPERPSTPDLEEGPTFTPYTVAPEVSNRPEVYAALERAYPALLRDAGIGGTTRVYFLVDAEGRVLDTRIDRTSGHEALDRAALEVAEVMEFTPARNRQDPVAVWISLPITFGVR